MTNPEHPGATIALGTHNEDAQDAYASGIDITHARVERGTDYAKLCLQIEHDGTDMTRALRNAATWTLEAVQLTTGARDRPAGLAIEDIETFEPASGGRQAEAFALRLPNTLARKTQWLHRAARVAAQLAGTGRNPRTLAAKDGQGTITTMLVQGLRRSNGVDEDVIAQSNTSVWIDVLERNGHPDLGARAAGPDGERAVIDATAEWVLLRTRWTEWESAVDPAPAVIASYEATDTETRTVWTLRHRNGGPLGGTHAKELMEILAGTNGTTRLDCADQDGQGASSYTHASHKLH